MGKIDIRQLDLENEDDLPEEIVDNRNKKLGELRKKQGAQKGYVSKDSDE